MNILVIGSGGREHALVWKLRQSPMAGTIYCAPGNPGIGALAELVTLDPTDPAGIADFVQRHDIGLTVVGPEQPLADGVGDFFEQRGLPLFGPTRRAAELEWSKAFAKEFMVRHRIPTAAHRTFSPGDLEHAHAYLKSCPIPVVLKADGLAAGKGVLICNTRAEALGALHEMVDTRIFGKAGTTVVIEEFMEGEEASVFAVTDGHAYALLAPAQDHKRVADHDRGKNTGGMGAYAPAPCVTPALMQVIETSIIRPTLAGMASEGRLYRGCLYVGLMITAQGPRVVEFNARFGDPESQVVLPLYNGDLAELLLAAARGELAALLRVGQVPPVEGHAVCVVLASGGYPDPYPTGIPIHGLERLQGMHDIVVFHAGTKLHAGKIVTAGGRVLGVTAVCRAGTLADTIRSAYAGVAQISFEGAHYRHDIGRKGLRATM